MRNSLKNILYADFNKIFRNCVLNIACFFSHLIFFNQLSVLNQQFIKMLLFYS